MKTNLLLALAALCGLLLAHAAPRAGSPPAGPVGEGTLSEPLIPFPPEAISAARVCDPSGCATLPRDGHTRQKADEVLAVLTQARVLRRFAVAPTALADYGLQEPALQVAVQRAGGRFFEPLFIGNRNPIGNAVYVRSQNKAEVWLVGSYFLTALDMALQGLRTKEGTFIETTCADEEMHEEE